MDGARFDFHIHTRLSDGALKPEEVIARAARAGLDGISLTDHDTADAYAELGEAWRMARRPRILPGIEVSASREGIELHILGYFPDGFPAGIEEFVDRLLAERGERIQEGLDRLRKRGMALAWEEVQSLATGRVVSRGHLAQALVKRRYLPSIHAAFPAVLGPDTVRPPGVCAREVVAQIACRGGIAVWAHPTCDQVTRFLDELAEAGLAGVELHTPRRRTADRRRIWERTRARGLFASGGSDWHGHEERPALGDFSVAARDLSAFLHAVGWRS